MATNIELGQAGEEIAAKHLESLGFAVLVRNWRCREGELDIIATDGNDTLVICEVKTRSQVSFGLPIEQITEGKRRRIKRLANLWLMEHRMRYDLVIRFDVIGVLLIPGQEQEITHLTGAF